MSNLLKSLLQIFHALWALVLRFFFRKPIRFFVFMAISAFIVFLIAYQSLIISIVLFIFYCFFLGIVHLLHSVFYKNGKILSINRISRTINMRYRIINEAELVPQFIADIKTFCKMKSKKGMNTKTHTHVIMKMLWTCRDDYGWKGVNAIMRDEFWNIKHDKSNKLPKKKSFQITVSDKVHTIKVTRSGKKSLHEAALVSKTWKEYLKIVKVKRDFYQIKVPVELLKTLH